MDEFNPYHEWLGLERALRQPTHYELLGIDRNETSAEIAAVAVAAMYRVRKCRPGPRLAQWTQLFDELVAAKKLLCDPLQRAEYDRQLDARRPSPALPDRRPVTRPQSSAAAETATAARPVARRKSATRIAKRAHSTPPTRHPKRHAKAETAAPRPARAKWLALPLSLANAFAERFLRSA
jgi:curved DNA-binding protein CbpA